jgi:hypothetical protein
LAERLRPRGSIARLGTSSGVRCLVVNWSESPSGAFAEVVLAEPDGTRWLLAPTPQLAAFAAELHRADEVRVVPVSVRHDWSFVRVLAGELDLRYLVGRRTPLGLGLRAVPERVATTSWWSRMADPATRSLLRGVRTGAQGVRGRAEAPTVTGHRTITRAMGSWRAVELGSLAPVSPDPGFGVGSTSERPSVVTWSAPS